MNTTLRIASSISIDHNFCCISQEVSYRVGKMSSTTEHHRQFGQTLHDTAPSSRQAAKFVTATTVGGCLLVIAALILTGTVIALVLATPVLVLFSPVLVPAAITLAMIAGGFIFSGTCGVAAISALSWIYRYVTGKHPPGADRLDYARMTIADKARDMSDYVQHKTHQATHA